MRTLVVILGCLLASTPTLADVTFRVGPGGTHTTIQSALDDTAGHTGRIEIRVAAGTYRELLRVGPIASDSEVLLLGGYDAGFADRNSDPMLTTIDGGGVAPVVRVPHLDTGTLTIASFTITGGNRPPPGVGRAGGVFAQLSGDAAMSLGRVLVQENRLEHDEGITGGAVQLFIRDRAKADVVNSVIRANHTRAPGATAGGLSAHVFGSGQLNFENNELLDNAAIATESAATAGGADIFAGDDALVWVTDNRFWENAARGNVEASDGALNLVVQGNAKATVRDNHFMGNRTTATSGSAHAAIALHAQRQEGRKGRARIEVFRNWFRHNTADGDRSPQVWVNALGADVFFHDSEIVTGSGAGVWASTDKAGRVYLTNLTVSRNAGRGLWAQGEGAMFLSNSIVFGNGLDEVVGVTATTNLQEDPSFVDAPADFRLRLGSRALDAGTNDPPGGVSTSDLAHTTRIQNGRVDIGAHERSPSRPPRLGHGCLVRLAGPYSPYVLADNNVCTCVRDLVLRSFRCGFLTGDFLLDLRAPDGWKEGEPIDVTWSLRPWRAELEPAFGFSAEALIDGKWVPQKAQTKGKLELDELTKKTLRLVLPATGSTLVRTSIEYRRKGESDPSRLEIDLEMPDPAFARPPKKP